MKKGPWSVAEDMVLSEYISINGEGNWNMVERNSGLNRRGKSCRLRWFNHLRPDLKRGPFSAEEERIVVQLHAKFGNRWAHIAKKLPGRSDNEIKNFWNTRTKRLERAGLPLYPESLIQRRIQIQLHNQRYINRFSSPTETHFPIVNGTDASTLVLSNLKPEDAEFRLAPNLSMGPFSLTGPPNSNPLTFVVPTNPNPALPNPSLPVYTYSINANGINFRQCLNSSYSPLSSTLSSSTMPNTNSQTCMSPEYPIQSKFINLDLNPNKQRNMASFIEPQSFFSTNYGEIYLTQSDLTQSLLDPLAFCESSNGTDFMNFSNFKDSQPVHTSDGLLQDISRVPKTWVPNDNLSHKGKKICMWDSDCGPSSFNTATATATGMKICDPIREMSPLDYDLCALIENFPEEHFKNDDWYDGVNHLDEAVQEKTNHS